MGGSDKRVGRKNEREGEKVGAGRGCEWEGEGGRERIE